MRCVSMSVQRIVCFGDSITFGKREPVGFAWTAQVATELNRSFPGKFEVFNRGVGGNTTAQGLERFAADVAPLLPAVVLVEFGFNDAHVAAGIGVHRVGLSEFQRNLLEMIRLVRAGKGRPVLLANHPIPADRTGTIQGNGKSYAANFRPYQPAIRSVAEKSRTPLIDLEKSMKRSRVSLAELLIEDGLHLSRSGNAIYARHVLRGLEKTGFLPTKAG